MTIPDAHCCYNILYGSHTRNIENAMDLRQSIKSMVKKIPNTGMSGLIGSLLKDHLQEIGGYELTTLNKWPVG